MLYFALSINSNTFSEKIFDEKVHIEASSKINSIRPGYKPGGGDVMIFDEKVRVNARSRIDSIRPDYKPSGGDVVIIDEKVKIDAQPRIDANNSNYSRRASEKKVIFNFLFKRVQNKKKDKIIE
jgi:hypothetical protein